MPLGISGTFKFMIMSVLRHRLVATRCCRLRGVLATVLPLPCVMRSCAPGEELLGIPTLRNGPHPRSFSVMSCVEIDTGPHLVVLLGYELRQLGPEVRLLLSADAPVVQTQVTVTCGLRHCCCKMKGNVCLWRLSPKIRRWAGSAGRLGSTQIRQCTPATVRHHGTRPHGATMILFAPAS